MSTAPFDEGLIVQRLQQLVPKDVLRHVGTLDDYGKLKGLGDFPVPCAYVIVAAERPEPTKTGMAMPGKQQPLPQVVPVGIGIVMACRNYRGLIGNELRSEMRRQVGAVRNVLLGWTPPVAGARPLQLISGDLDDYDTSVAVWIDKWHTQHIIKPEISA